MLIRDTEGNLQYYYIDDYMFFSFNGINSRKYNLFITNDKKGYNWYTDTGASVKVEKPLYQGYTYYTGIDRSEKKIDLNVAAEGLTEEEIKEMFLWLEEGSTGFLTIDWNRDWGYDMVLNKVSNPEYMGYGRNSVITFKLTFQTVGEFRARAAWDITADISRMFSDTDREKCIANEYGIPELDVRCADSTIGHTIIYLPTIGNQYGYIDYFTSLDLTTQQSKFTISTLNADLTKNQEYIHYILNSTGQKIGLSYYGRSGYLVANNNKLVESVDELIKDVQLNSNNTLIRLQGTPPKSIKTNLVIDDKNNTITLTLDKNLLEKLSYIERPYISISVLKSFPGQYGQQYYSNSHYPTDYYNWIAYLPVTNDMSLINRSTIDIVFSGYNNAPFTNEEQYLHVKPIPEEYQGDDGHKRFNALAKIYYGSYNILQIETDTAADYMQLTVHKYNNL